MPKHNALKELNRKGEHLIRVARHHAGNVKYQFKAHTVGVSRMEQLAHHAKKGKHKVTEDLHEAEEQAEDLFRNVKNAVTGFMDDLQNNPEKATQKQAHAFVKAATDFCEGAETYLQGNNKISDKIKHGLSETYKIVKEAIKSAVEYLGKFFSNLLNKKPSVEAEHHSKQHLQQFKRTKHH